MTLLVQNQIFIWTDVVQLEEDLPRLGVEIGNVLSDKERLEDDVLVINLQGGDLAVGVDVLEIPVGTGDREVNLNVLIWVLCLGEGKDCTSGEGAELVVVEDELLEGHC